MSVISIIDNYETILDSYEIVNQTALLGVDARSIERFFRFMAYICAL